MQQQSMAHKHDIIYYGVVNLIHDSTVMGTIDVWKCRGCNEIFCEDKRYGVQDLAAEVGFPKVEQGAKWGALVCIKEKGSDWTLTGVKPGIILHHSCTPETKVDLTVGNDYSIEQGMASGIGRHRIILIEDFVNAAVDVETGRKHSGPTNANQAPGRPFSFPAEKPATPATVSLYNISNVSGLTSALVGVWSGALAISSSVMSIPGFLLLVGGILGIVSAYFTMRRKSLGPMLAFATSALGIVGLVAFNFGVGNLGTMILLILLLANGVFAWFSRTKIKRLTGQQWHPLDMPAYG